MKAVVYRGPGKVAVEEVPDPKLQEPTDIILKLTSSGICGSDLHMYEGHTDSKPGTVLGHEPMGVVDQAGDAVRLLKKGDRVVVPFNVACGFCLNCIQGKTDSCLTVNPSAPHGAYGYAEMGPFAGAQAEYLRVPYGDWACLKLPGKPFDENEEDFVLLSDIFPTGYYSTDLAHVSTGASVAIFGAGPVGLLATLSCRLRGTAETYVVDRSDRRLELAKSLGGMPINFMKGDPVETIMNMRKNNRKLREEMRPGEEKMMGTDCVIDAVGFQAFDRKDPSKYKPNQVLMDAGRLVNQSGHIGVIGVYVENDPKADNDNEKKGNLRVPWGEYWSKGVSIAMGQTPVKQHHVALRDTIVAGKARPGVIVTNRISIDEAPEFYRKFDKRDEVVKAIIQFK